MTLSDFLKLNKIIVMRMWQDAFDEFKLATSTSGIGTFNYYGLDIHKFVIMGHIYRAGIQYRKPFLGRDTALFGIYDDSDLDNVSLFPTIRFETNVTLDILDLMQRIIDESYIILTWVP